jgi:hypothetical protein
MNASGNHRSDQSAIAEPRRAKNVDVETPLVTVVFGGRFVLGIGDLSRLGFGQFEKHISPYANEPKSTSQKRTAQPDFFRSRRRVCPCGLPQFFNMIFNVP